MKGGHKKNSVFLHYSELFGPVMSKMSLEWQEQLLHRVIKACRAFLQFTSSLRKTALNLGFSSCSRYARTDGVQEHGQNSCRNSLPQPVLPPTGGAYEVRMRSDELIPYEVSMTSSSERMSLQECCNHSKIFYVKKSF